jgi:hypothetical protein
LRGFLCRWRDGLNRRHHGCNRVFDIDQWHDRFVDHDDVDSVEHRDGWHSDHPDNESINHHYDRNVDYPGPKSVYHHHFDAIDHNDDNFVDHPVDNIGHQLDDEPAGRLDSVGTGRDRILDLRSRFESQRVGSGRGR